jgi:non-heme chloroperoxidase
MISSSPTIPRLNFKDTGGEGTPILMIHGFPLSHEAFEHQFEAFAVAGLRAIAYDRRGFGDSEKPGSGYDYDTLADDLAGLINSLNLSDVLLLGFSMGGGEVARYVSRYGADKLSGVIFAASVTPFLLKSNQNPDGPLDQAKADEKLSALEADRDKYFEGFVKKFYEVSGNVVVSQSEVDKAIRLCKQSDQTAAIGCMKAFSSTDFRRDLKSITVPTLVIHGDSDAVVPIDGSGKRTADLVKQAELEVIPRGPHGINVSHADPFNRRVIAFAQAARYPGILPR